MQKTELFDAKDVSQNADCLYRVYAQAGEFYFICLGSLGQTAQALSVHFGLLGMLIGSALKKRAKKQAEAVLQRAEGQDLESLLREHKKSFKVYIPEISEAVVEPPALFAMHGTQTGSWNFKLHDGKKFRFEFETTEAMQAAMNQLPRLLNATLRVNAEWNEAKKKFQKIKNPG